MNKNKKSKIVLFSVIGLAAVSIGTVGFATWVVGVQRTEVGLQLSAKVDDTQNKSIMLEAEIDTNYTFKVAETEEHNSITNNDLVVTGNSGTNTSIGFDSNAMKFQFSKLQFSCGDAATKPTKLTLKLATNDANSFNTVTKTANKLPTERTGTSWTYLSLDYTLTLDYNEGVGKNVTAKSKVGGESYTTYEINTKIFDMHWGTFFGNESYANNNTSPLKYYNSISNKKENESGPYVYDTPSELFTLADNIHSEISTMNSVLNNSSNKLQILVKVE
ncbi:MAG: hypothetical protein PUF99_04565 [Bacilli bacterium]|nr:hypothetical protein [Bacilli bacterium]